MDLNYPGESSNGAFDLEALRGNADSSVVSGQLFQSAYADLFRGLPLDHKGAPSSEQTEKSSGEQKKDTSEQPGKPSQIAFGDFQGQVPEAYLKYLDRYKDAGANKPAPASPDVNPVTPAPKPDQPKPQVKPDQPSPDQPVQPGPGKILPGPRPQPEVKPEPAPTPGVNPNPKPKPGPQPCPKPG